LNIFDIKEMVDSIDFIFLDKRVVYAKRDPRRYMNCDSESLIDQDWLTWPEYEDRGCETSLGKEVFLSVTDAKLYN
jgi:hypothetical protein